IQSDVTEIKTEVRRLNDKVDALDDKIYDTEKRLTAKIEGVDQKLSGKIEALKDAFSDFKLQMEKSFAELRFGRMLDRVWYLLMSAALLGVMARAFKWI